MVGSTRDSRTSGGTRAAVAAAALSVASLGALAEVSLEFTYFHPDRCRRQRGGGVKAMESKWGESWTWPLKTFPADSDQENLGKFYGLVYWPGETVDVHVKGGAVERVTCTDELAAGRALAAAPKGNGLWQVAIPRRSFKKPYLALYRVRAFRGGEEVASRGLIVTVPWSGVREGGDPYWWQTHTSFGEWQNGSSPFTQMCFQWGQKDKYDDTEVLPARNRPWGFTNSRGTRELLGWGSCRARDYAEYSFDELDLDSEDYADPSLEWQAWWTYYAHGASHWDRGWQWGPWNSMSADQVQKGGGNQHAEYNVCSGLAKKQATVLPNGLLYMQWMYYGMKRMVMQNITHLWKHRGVSKRRAVRHVFHLYDGWEDPIGTGKHQRYAEEKGAIYAYYKRCQALGRDTTWAKRHACFDDFYKERKAAFRGDDATDDFYYAFLDLDLNRRNMGLYAYAAGEAYEEYTGEDEVGYHSNCVRAQPYDYAPFQGLPRDLRPTVAAYNDVLAVGGHGTNMHTGFDYGHAVGYHRGTDWWKSVRAYRSHGYVGAMGCGLWPRMFFPGGHRYTEKIGSVVPGSAHWGKDGEHYEFYARHCDDGTSHRRKDMFERAGMFYDASGICRGYEVAACYGGWKGDPNYTEYSRNPEWNTQATLGMQVMEIPDRVRPIAGVMVVDSDNAADRARGCEFVTERAFADYVAAVHDMLGIVTYVNGANEPKVPRDVPRVHAPRKDGDGSVWLVAEVAGQKVRAPYTGQTMQRPDSEQLRDFVRRVRAAYPGGWPIRAEGGFAAAAWESSRGVFVYVENPMERKGVIHTQRRGRVAVRIRGGYDGEPAVVDLCGLHPDPRRLRGDEVEYRGDWVVMKLDWPKGDARLFWIDAETPSTNSDLEVTGATREPVGARGDGAPRAVAPGRDPGAGGAGTVRPGDDVIVAFDAMIMERVMLGLAEGRAPSFYLSSRRTNVTVTGVEDVDVLAVVAQRPRIEFKVTWRTLTLSDKRSLALGVMREDRRRDHAMVAFYCLATGDRAKAAEHLAKAGDAAADVVEAFGGPSR